MSLHMLPAAETAEPSPIGTFLDTLIHDVLPACALGAGLMAVIWIACAAITFAGAFTGAVVVAAIRTMAQSCANYLRRWDAEHDQPVTADVDAAADTIIDLNHYREHEHHQDDVRCDDPFRNDDPA